MTAVWLYGTHLGDLTRPRHRKLRFDFAADALDRWGSNCSILSTSMPASTVARPPGDIVSAFFRNLLPEGSALGVMQAMYQATDDFALLEAIGNDTAGALIISDTPSVEPSEPSYLSLAAVGRLVDDIPQRPLGASSEVRHSLAGAQDKVLLGRTTDGRWYEASASHPSTHILKPAPADHAEVATNEAFCMQLARAVGMETCRTEELQLGSLRILVAERYDRVDGQRVHQEDGCQMLGVAPEHKYQQRKAGRKWQGPSLAGIAAWLTDVDKVRLLQAQVLNVLVGNADCHGKNISILHLPDGSIRLAPLYDVMSTVVHHPIPTTTGPRPLSRDLGLIIGNARTLDDVTVDDFVREAGRWLMPRDQISHLVRVAIQQIALVAQQQASMYPLLADHVAQTAERLLLV